MEFHLSTATTSLLTLLLFLYCLLKWKNYTHTNKGKEPPIPSNSWPIIGHLHLLSGLPHISLGKLADTYGPIFMIKLGKDRALVVSSAEMAKQCLGAGDKVFLNRPHKIFVEHMAYNTALLGFSPYGEYWRELRKIITIELLSNHRVEMFKNVRVSEVRSGINRISGTGSELVDMKQWFHDISINTIIRLVSGKSSIEFHQSEVHNQCMKAIRDFFELAGVFVPADALPFLRWLDIGGYEKKMKRVAKVIDVVAQKWLEEHKERKSSKEKDEKRDFMDVMLSVFETGQDKPFKFDSDTIIKATSMAMILAATDTTAVTLTWALSLLLNNKDILKKTQAELDNVVGKERQVEESDLKNLVYLQAVLKETMRLYPAAPLSVPREAITDCTVSGYYIPVGTQLFVNLYKIHRDPEVWEDPLEFHPERFLTTYKQYDVRGQQFEYMPFGSGRRICPGISFALLAMQFTLASLLHGFDISIPCDGTVDMTEGFGLTNLKATPLEVIATHRLPRNIYSDMNVN
ncbi:cytochrome P450 CYP82D47-like [Beta vulgaris subsp. vulgaris]|uniref:cytochrome P450 CYP82D47-like n=1 Tax=Beta vulgaris subsp. vulgaris TaxID=3555 RepID=UPI00203760D9|nr:cytochrome P450 CYP82D47-like [Beta vulgaris subsp. vulgaris]